MYRKSVLKNGLRIVTHEIKDRDSISLGILVGVGGRHEDDRLKGAAHYLEHVVFKGTKKYSCDEIKETVEGVGGSLNAFTSEEQTCFYAKIPSKFLSRTFDVLSDLVFEPSIAPKDVERERGVILEEIKMYHDLPQYYVMELLEHLVWPEHPLGKSLAGTFESVDGMTQKQLKQFYQTHYIPNNIVVSACGNVTHQDLVDLVRKKTEKGSFGKKVEGSPAPSGQQAPRVSFCVKPIEQMHVALGTQGVSINHESRYALGILNVIMGGNMSSRLFNEVREKRGLAYSIGTASKNFSDTGIFMMRAGVENTKVEKSLSLVLSEFKKVKTSGISKEEFSRAKEYTIGQLVLALEDTMEHMLWVGESTLLRDHIRTTDEVIQSVKKVRLDDVQTVAAKVLNERQYNLAVVGPLTDQQQSALRSMIGSD